MLLKGKELADSILEQIKNEIIKGRIAPVLRIVMVGNDPASQVYVKKKVETAEKLGIDAELIHLPGTASEAEVFALVDNLNRDRKVDGFIVQLPLPRHINTERIVEAIAPGKDVDGLHALNLGRIAKGLEQGFQPATPAGIMRLLDNYKVQLAGANAVVVGRSNLVGKPIALMLLERNATVSICHSKTWNLAEYTKKADVLVVAAGKPGLITPDMVKDGAYVVDVGTTRVNGKLRGDVADEVQRKANVSPVPGGVGPLTVAMLLLNVLKAAKIRDIDKK